MKPRKIETRGTSLHDACAISNTGRYPTAPKSHRRPWRGQCEAFRGRARPSKARAARPRPAERGLQPSSKPPRPRPAASNPLEALPQNIESAPSIKANRHVHRVQKMTTLMRDRAIANFPLLDYFAESHCN